MIEELLQHLTVGKALGWAGVAGLLLLVTWELQIALQSRKLGYLAPTVPSYLPLGIDFIYRAFQSAKKSEDLLFFDGLLDKSRLPNGERGNTIELRLRGFARSVFTIDSENIKAVLTGQFPDYGKGERFHEEWKEFLGDSIFATDGELWQRSRQLLRPMFARERIVETQMFETHVDKLIRLLGGAANPNGQGVVDVGPLFFRLTLDAATDHLLGQPVNSLDNPKTTFGEAFQFVLHKQTAIFRAGPLAPFFSRREFRKNLKKMDDFMQPFIEHARGLSDAELDQSLSKRENFLHALARFTRDPQILRDQIVAVLLAGRDTTAATLSFCIFELARHPGVVSKLRDEIASHVGLGASARHPSYADLKEMKYLNAVLNETMRLYPVVPFNVRHSLKNTTLPRGGGKDGSQPVGVPADTRIIYSTMALQRRRDLYDPPPSESESASASGSEKQSRPYFDPHLYEPDRWVSGWQPRPWQFIPFNGGPRICLGQQFATIEMGYTVTRILQTYSEIRAAGDVPPPGTDPKFKFDVTLSPGQELNCVFVK